MFGGFLGTLLVGGDIIALGGGERAGRCTDDDSDTWRPCFCLSKAKSCERGSAVGLVGAVIVPADRAW